MTDLKHRFDTIIEAIHSAETAAERPPGSAKLLAVSKTWRAEHLRAVAALGQVAFGENYVQEALEKIQALNDLNLEWHFIGPVQSNKTRDIAEYFDWVHSIDRVKIANRLNEQRPATLPPLNVCIQINIDAEETKSGIQSDELLSLADHIVQLKNLRLRGLMLIPAPTELEEKQQQTFKHAYMLYQTLQEHFQNIDTLSMGMSNDMISAIQQGSTMVRIGTALFGQRNKHNFSR